MKIKKNDNKNCKLIFFYHLSKHVGFTIIIQSSHDNNQADKADKVDQADKAGV
jgi:hypothetical protein